MKTRHAEEGSEFRQERYMSASELERGLLANCVASRLRVVDDREQRKLIWWLALASHEAGGLDRIAQMMIELWPERFRTAPMQKLGFAKGRIYVAEEVREVRNEMWRGQLWRGEYEFPLRNEVDIEDFTGDITAVLNYGRRCEMRRRPKSYPAAAFAKACLDAARRELAGFLFEELCLNPAVKIDERTLWYLPDLLGALRDCHAAWIAEKADACPVTTSVGAAVEETLDYALTLRGAGQSIVVIDGLARIGKTFAVKMWLARHPGEARYVQVPSSNDDISFFRAIGDAIGVGGGRAAKAHELRDKIEDVLRAGGLALLLDEGHHLWPQRNYRKAVPHRINWLMTQLVNHGVPVALITTPQFTKSQETLVKHGGWSSEQFIGRIAHYERLPESLPAEELREVARTFMPAADDASLQTLVDYAQASEKYLAGIEALARRSHYLAARNGRSTPSFADVKEALQSSVVPSDNALFATVANPHTARAAGALQAPRNIGSTALKKPCKVARGSTLTPRAHANSRRDSSGLLAPT